MGIHLFENLMEIVDILIYFLHCHISRNDNHPMMQQQPPIKLEPGIKLEPIDGMSPQVDSMMQQLDSMAPSPGQMGHMDGSMPLPPHAQPQYNPQMHYDMQQQQHHQYQQMNNIGMPTHPQHMGMNMGGPGGPPPPHHMGGMMPNGGMPQPGGPVAQMALPTPPTKKAAAKKKKVKQEKDADGKEVKKPRRKFDRFHGMPEEEVVKRTLPDLLVHNLEIVIVSSNITTNGLAYFSSRASKVGV